LCSACLCVSLFFRLVRPFRVVRASPAAPTADEFAVPKHQTAIARRRASSRVRVIADLAAVFRCHRRRIVISVLPPRLSTPLLREVAVVTAVRRRERPQVARNSEVSWGRRARHVVCQAVSRGLNRPSAKLCLLRGAPPRGGIRFGGDEVHFRGCGSAMCGSAGGVARVSPRRRDSGRAPTFPSRPSHRGFFLRRLSLTA